MRCEPMATVKFGFTLAPPSTSFAICSVEVRTLACVEIVLEGVESATRCEEGKVGGEQGTLDEERKVLGNEIMAGFDDKTADLWGVGETPASPGSILVCLDAKLALASVGGEAKFRRSFLRVGDSLVEATTGLNTE